LRESFPKIDGKAAVVAISFEDAVTQKRSHEELQLPYPLLADPRYQAIDRYPGREPNKTYSNPAAFIIDKDGKVKWSYVGNGPSDRPPVDMIVSHF